MLSELLGLHGFGQVCSFGLCEFKTSFTDRPFGVSGFSLAVTYVSEMMSYRSVSASRTSKPLVLACVPLFVLL